MLKDLNPLIARLLKPQGMPQVCKSFNDPHVGSGKECMGTTAARVGEGTSLYSVGLSLSFKKIINIMHVLHMCFDPVHSLEMQTGMREVRWG